MSKVRVPLHGKPQGYATVDTEATPGAVVGVNLRWRTGDPVSEQALVAALQGGGVQTGGGTVYWRTIMEIPPNVTALAEQAGTGLYVLDDAGSSVTRTLAVEPGELTLTNGDGVGGNPTLGLPTISPDAGGALKRYGFDTKGRRTHEEPADTDDLDEGESNLYFTDERAQSAVVTQAIDSGDTSHAPSGDAVFDALDIRKSGRYTPICSGVQNVSSCVGNTCNWSRVAGGLVVSGSVVITPTASNSSVTVSVSLPFTTEFTDNLDCSGPVSGKAAGIPSYEVGQVLASAGTGNLQINFYPSTTNAYTMRFCVVVPVM